MRRPILFTMVAVLLVVAGCSWSDSPVAPRHIGQGTARYDEYSGDDCELTVDQCEKILNAITALIAHPNEVCAELGWQAYDRYSDPASSGSYKWEPQQYDSQGNPYAMGVALPLDPSDGETQVYDFYWNNQYTDNDSSNAALIAHEEWHHNGYGESEAKAMQNECSTWQA